MPKTFTFTVGFRVPWWAKTLIRAWQFAHRMGFSPSRARLTRLILHGMRYRIGRGCWRGFGQQGAPNARH